jgi:AmmeMemoRadiSam system protein B
MKLRAMYLLPLFLVASLILTVCSAVGQSLRPVRDDVGFCWRAVEMDSLMAYLVHHQVDTPAVHGTVIGGISPHDDYLYAGRVYFPLYRLVNASNVIIIGLTHGTVRKEIGDPHGVLLFDDFDQWHGPYGPVDVSPLRSYVTARLDTAFWKTNRKAQVLEHSIEAIVPFLQYYRRDVRILPIMVTAMPLERMKDIAESLASIVCAYAKEHHLRLGTDLAVIVSTDADHYGADFGNTPFGDDSLAHVRGTALDRNILRESLAGTLDEQHVRRFVDSTWGGRYTESGKSLWCGRYSVPFGCLFTADLVSSMSGGRVSAVPLAYSDTWTEKVLPVNRTHMGTTAPFSLKHWVGWCSVAFELR